MDSLDVNSIKFLPYQWRKYPLYEKIVCPLIDWALDASKERFQYVTGKYSKYLELDESLAKELISELGFEYILDGVTLNSLDIRIIFGYLRLFHLLKGSKPGLKLVIDLLGYEYVELEWFEKTDGSYYTRAELMDLIPLSDPDIPTDPYTFKLELNLLLQNFDSNKLSKFVKFTRHYVYDILRLFLNLFFDCSELLLNLGGFIDQELVSEGNMSNLFLSFGGFIDQELTSPLIIYPINWVFAGIPTYLQIGTFLSGTLTLSAMAGWDTTKRNCTKFKATFDVPSIASDGFTFTIQNEGLGAVGDPGGGLGAYDTTDPVTDGIQSAVHVEIDTFYNSGWDAIAGIHIGVNINGNPVSLTSISDSGLNSRTYIIEYDGTDLKVFTSDISLIVPILTYTIDIPGTVGDTEAYFGFTNSGGVVGVYTNISWEFGL